MDLEDRVVGRLRTRLFSISLDETSFMRRGFHRGEPAAQERLERVGAEFLHGYHASLAEDDPARLAIRLDAVEREWRGFAFEGAAMGLALFDQFTPWSGSRLQAFINGPANPHIYMAHVGAGWVLARLRRGVQCPPARLDPLLGWLAVDGYGFHEGYFRWRRYHNGQPIPDRLQGYARCVFDQGLGRSLWFVEGADVARISKTIAAFPESRRADLWSGIGLACAYTGGAAGSQLEELAHVGAAYLPHLAQGAAFAAKARERAGNPAAHTERACRVLCGMPASAAAAVTDIALRESAGHDSEPAYEAWRQGIRTRLIRETVLA